MRYSTRRAGRQRSRISEMDSEAMAPACDWHGCKAKGLHRAPRSPTQLREYRWFCLEHIRQYNASWNYYAGMTEEQVEADVRRDTVWQRPSWPLGAAMRAHAFQSGRVRDHLGVFGDGEPEAPRQPVSPEQRALVVLDLDPPVTVEIVKARYKKLVKRHHPDANGGDKVAEEKFKQISEAYRTILRSLDP